MIAPRGLNIAELDERASTAEAPYAIITADCSEPKEIDDGIVIQELPAHRELYRVGVCVVDTSPLYTNGDVFKQAMKRTAARYWQLPHGERGYEPMLPAEMIRGREFSAGNVRDAMTVSFVIGMRDEPSDVEVSFGKVEVRENLSYKEFAERYQSEETARKYARASAAIIKHLRYVSGGDDDTVVHAGTNIERIYNWLAYGSSEKIWNRGSRANEAFMIAAGHLVGKLMKEENRPAIYRVHDPEDEQFIEFLPPDMATYSRTPGWHDGLQLGPYCRVTSPLRRLEDFVMSYMLKQRYLGKEPTMYDAHVVAAAVQQLNRAIMTEVFQGPLRMERKDTLGRAPVVLGRVAAEGADIITLPRSGATATAS